MTATFSACIYHHCAGWHRLVDIGTMSLVGGYYVLWFGEIHGIITGIMQSNQLAQCLNIIGQVDASLRSIGETVSYRKLRIFCIAQLITVFAYTSFRLCQAYLYFGYKMYLSVENNLAVLYMFIRLAHFTTYVFILREKFVQVNSILLKMGHELSEVPMFCMTDALVKKLKVVRDSHMKLCKAGTIVDNYFGIQNVVFILTIFLAVSYSLYFTVQYSIYSKPVNRASAIVVYSLYLLAMTWMIIAVLVLSLCASTSYQLNLFSLHVKQHKLVFTGWRMFNLDFKFLYDFTTAIFTYVIIFDQMKKPLLNIKD
ncbi:hypothetical protein CBL_02486 [Carabus blaptoides fortunei]